MSLADLTNLTEAELLERHGLEYLLHPHSCEFCEESIPAPTEKVCLTCYDAWYCSTEHMLSGKDAHQFNCSSPLEVKQNDTFGQYYVAARDLDAGVLILDESPVLGSPRAEPDNNEDVYCLSCCKQMENEDYRRCSKCTWPVCSPACEKKSVHAKHECKFFSTHGINFPLPFDRHITYKAVFLIRGIFIKQTDPALWSQLQELDGVAPKLGDIQLFPNLTKYKQLIGVPPDFGDAHDWNKLQGITNVNAFRGEKDSKSGNFLFLKASLFAQSCAPNAVWDIFFEFPKSPDLGTRIRIYTTTKISKGEIVGISYMHGDPKKGTEARQNAGFYCKCARCIDPTELGTYTSALKCQSCANGYILPTITPAINAKESIWKCNTPGCTFRIHGDKVEGIISIMDEGLVQLPLSRIENYMSKQLANALHPNHWILLKCSSRIVLETDITDVNRFSGEKRDMYISHCKNLLKVYDIVAPGLNQLRGWILRALGPPSLRKLDDNLKSENMSQTLLEALKIYESLKEAFLALKDHPANTPTPPDNYDIRDYSILLVMNNAKEFIEALRKVTPTVLSQLENQLGGTSIH